MPGILLEEPERQFRALGVTSFLDKPCNEHKLAETLSRLFGCQVQSFCCAMCRGLDVDPSSGIVHEMNLESERDFARCLIKLFQSRYAGQDDSFGPLRLARAWQEEVMKAEFDPLALIQIRDEAKSMQNRFDIAFFTFCNHIDGMVKELTRPIGI